jgi:hypothetical protein
LEEEEEEEHRRIRLRAKLQSSFQDYGQGLKKKQMLLGQAALEKMG